CLREDQIGEDETMKRQLGSAVLIILSVAARGKADSVECKNGERLIGEWVRIEGGNLIFKSDTVGNVTLPLDKVSSLTTTKPAVVLLRSGQAVRGQIGLSPTHDWEVTQAGRTQTLKPMDVASVYTAETYRQREAAERPRLWQAWKGSTNAGYSLNKGAQNARSLSLGINAVRSQPDFPGLQVRWRTNFTTTMLFSTNTTDGAKITSNTLSSNLRQDYLFDPNNFVFIIGQLDHIQPQNLYLRQTYGGGVGRDLFKKKHLTLSVLGGLTFVNEKFGGAGSSQYAESLAGEKLAYDISKNIHLDHYLNLYPNLSNAGEYRFDTTTMLRFRLTAHLSADIGVTDFYTSQIVAGNPIPVIGPGGVIITLPASGSKNNIAFTTNLGFAF